MNVDNDLPFSEAPVLTGGPNAVLDPNLPGDDAPFSDEEIEKLVQDMQASMLADAAVEDNPLAGHQIHQLMATFLSVVPQGIRWLAEKGGVNRRALKTYLETGEGIDPAVVPKLIDIIVTRDTQDKQRMADKMARMSVELTDKSTDGIKKRATKKIESRKGKYALMTRAERRAAMARDRRAKKRVVLPPEGEPL